MDYDVFVREREGEGEGEEFMDYDVFVGEVGNLGVVSYNSRIRGLENQDGPWYDRVRRVYGIFDLETKEMLSVDKNDDPMHKDSFAERMYELEMNGEGRGVPKPRYYDINWVTCLELENLEDIVNNM